MRYLWLTLDFVFYKMFKYVATQFWYTVLFFFALFASVAVSHILYIFLIQVFKLT
jgi:hypothetical protein